jgi:2',3'-cyclic-nucleotide 2'-phosphodiesterase (5'-nucleotidase family)
MVDHPLLRGKKQVYPSVSHLISSTVTHLAPWLLVLALGCRARPARDPDAAAAPAAQRPRGTPLVLLYSSNLQGEYEAHPLGGLARRATLARRARAEAPGVIQVDAGDTLLPSLASLDREPREVERRASLLIDGLAQVGLDAVVPGETDLALGPARLKALAAKAGLPLVAANLTSDGKPWLAADRLLRVTQVPIGIFGIVDVSPGEVPAPLALTDPVAAARTAVASLRARGARLVVGLFHVTGGVARAREIVRAAAGIDVVVVGHDGATTTAPVMEGSTRLVEAHRRGTYAGRLELDVGPGEVEGRNRIVRLDPTIAPDQVLKGHIRTYIDETLRRIDRSLPAALAPAPAKQPDETWTYASNAACDLCHQKASEQFKTSPHATALMTLQSKGRGRDAYCFGCHTTAFGQPGGTRSLDTAITYFGSVGCESCHGPSVLHVRANKAERTRRQVPEAVCRQCHREDQQPQPFDYKEGLKLVLGPGHGDGGKGMR